MNDAPEKTFNDMNVSEPEQNIQPLVETRPWPKPIDNAAFNGLVGRLLNPILPHTEADPHAVLLQFLTIFGNIVGRNSFVQVERDRHYPNLFVTIVGDSSKARKGVSYNQAVHLVSGTDQTWYERCWHSGLSSGEGMAWLLRDSNPVSDKNGQADPGAIDKRALILESEFVSVLKNFGRQGNTLSAKMRDAWDRGEIENLTKLNPFRATDMHVSIIGHITSTELLRELNKTEIANGLGNRFLWAAVKRAQKLPHGGTLDEADLCQPRGELKEAVQFGQMQQQLVFSSTAITFWSEVYHRLTDDRPGIVGSLVSRAEAQILRLALIYALLSKSAEISIDHLESALAVWDYCERSCFYLFGKTLGDEVSDRIRALLEANPDGLSRTEINNALGGNKAALQIARALEILHVGCGAIKEWRATDGRRSEVWRLPQSTE